MVHRSRPFLIFFISPVRPPLRPIHAFTGCEYYDIRSDFPSGLVTLMPNVNALS